MAPRCSFIPDVGASVATINQRISFRPEGCLANRAALFHEQLYGSSGTSVFQRNTCGGSGFVSEIDRQGTEPGPVRRVTQHRHWKDGQKSSGRQQIQPHVD